MVCFQVQLCLCPCLCCLCPLSMCLNLLLSVFVPTLQPCLCDSFSLFVSHFGPTHIFVPSTLYTSVFVFVSNFVVCVNCIFVQLCLSAHSMPFCYSVSSCPLSFCQRCLCQIRSVCVQSACIVCAHSRCLCLLSSVSAPALLLPALCTLSVFVHFISHKDL